MSFVRCLGNNDAMQQEKGFPARINGSYEVKKGCMTVAKEP